MTVDGKTVGEIENGFLILLGVHQTDDYAKAELLAKKTADLRVFCDEQDKMNLSPLDVGGQALVVSNFTLCADTKKGNRPSFIEAMEPQKANELYLYYCEKLHQKGVTKVERGQFRADMQINLVNDGPVTIVLDTDTWCK